MNPNTLALTGIARILAPLAIAVILLVLFTGDRVRAVPGAQDVNVVNTPSVNVANAPSVNVTNIPSVNVGNAVRLAERSIVGIDSSANVVKLDPSSHVIADASPTVMAYSRHFDAGAGLSDVIDISAFKQIRIMFSTFDPTGVNCTVTPYSQVGPADPEVVQLDNPNRLGPARSGTATWDVPGTSLRFTTLSDKGCSVFVFGRSN